MRRLTWLLLLAGFIAPRGAAQASPNTWTYVQDSNILFCSQAGSAASCSIGAAQITPTLAGSVWILQVKTVNNVSISSITGGGGTWIKCPNCHVNNPFNGGNLDAWYNLTGTAGTTQNITVTLTGVSGGNGMGINFEEFLPPLGTTASFDASGTATPSPCTICTGVGLTITGTDFIWMNPGNGTQVDWKSVSAPWIIAGNGSMLNVNASSGAAPTINYELFNGNPISPTLMAIAFKSSAGVFTPPSYLGQNSIVQFFSPPTNPANLTPFCNPTCTLTLPQATQAGHLLFVMVSNLSNDHIVSASGGGTWVVPSGANTCQANWSLVQASGAVLSCAYVLSSTAGATSISVTLNGNASSGLAVWEIVSNTGLPWTLDTQGSRQNGTNNFSPPGVVLTIAGKNDVIFQGGFVPGGSSDASFYPLTYVAHQGVGYILFNEAAEQVLLNSGPTAPTSFWINPQGALQNTGMTAIAFTAAGKTYNAADCSFATVSALNAGASDGDAINLPACAQTNWGNNSTTGNGNLNVTKCVTISGAGPGSTIIGDNVLKDGQFNSMPFRFSGACGAIPQGPGNLTIVGVAPDASVFAKGHISLIGSGSAFRAHHITLTTPRTEFIVADYIGHALFDHNSVTGCSQGVGGIDMRSSGWNGGQFGDGSWADPTPLPGSANAYYVEDNTFNCGVQAQSAQIIDGHLGARWVVRFNTITSGAFTSHGTDQDRRRSMRWVEYYDNHMDFNSVTGGPSYFNWMRGGSGVVFDNTWSGLNPGSGTRTFYCRIASIPCGPISVWGACDGTGAYDGNQPGQNGHICVDQQGAGTSNLISGATPTPVAPVNNILQPIYSFHNTVDGGQTGSPVQVNRDIYLQDLTNCTTSGCTAGVGRGTAASKPATCTLNTGWFATDEGFWNTKTPGVAAGQLYRCGSSNNWVLYETPYTYPDPLQSVGAPTVGPAANVYLAQVAAGVADGSTCANARAASYFNLSANWGTGLTQIGSGTTINLCGSINIVWTPPTSQGTGLITLKYEPGAKLSAPANQNFIIFGPSTNKWKIDGGTLCGPQPSGGNVDVPCNGVIENTANGTNLANQVYPVVAIDHSQVRGDVEVVGVDIRNLYVHTAPIALTNITSNGTTTVTATCATACGFSAGQPLVTIQDSTVAAQNITTTTTGGFTQVGGATVASVSGTNITFIYPSAVAAGISSVGSLTENAIHNSSVNCTSANNGQFLGNFTIHDGICREASWAFAEGCSAGASVTFEAYHMDLFHTDHGLAIGGNNTDQSCTIKFHDNRWRDPTNWNTGTVNSYHHDGAHMFNSATSALAIKFWNNKWEGPFTGNSTAIIFPQSCPVNFTQYNDVLTVDATTTNDPTALWFTGGGANQTLWNNSIIQNGQPRGVNPAFTNSSTIFVQVQGGCPASANNTFLNNVSTSGTGLMSSQGAVYSANGGGRGLDYNSYANYIANGNTAFNWNGTTLTNIFATWQGASGEGIHSSLVASVNLDVNGIPQAGSPAIGTGFNICAVIPCTGDLAALAFDTSAGNTRIPTARPASGAWNMGAFGPAGSVGNPLVLLAPLSLPYINQLLGTSSAPQTITLTNTGTATLTITSITLGGANPTSWSSSTTCGAALLAGGSCTITATFTPLIAGALTATITLTSNASSSPNSIPLTGFGMVGMFKGPASISGAATIKTGP